MNDEPSKGPGTNTGHGHVWKRPDRTVARCGGTGMCPRCRADARQWPPGSPVLDEDLVKQINDLRAERDRLRLVAGQAVMLVTVGALRFIRDDAETQTILARWREALAGDE